MTDTNIQDDRHVGGPNPDLKTLDKLVGTWKHSGEIDGQTTYEWMEGGYFLMQRVDLVQFGHEIKGIEIIGHLRPFGEAPDGEIRSRLYGNMGDTLDYVYEIEGDTLTIWGGERGSPAYYQGIFSADGDTLTGAWHYPGGGGYQATAIRDRGA